MEWKVGQKVHYTYMPDNSLFIDKKKEYYGEIVDTIHNGIAIQWGAYDEPEIYPRSSYIIRHLCLIPELDEDNPNRKFVEDRAKHAIL